MIGLIFGKEYVGKLTRQEYLMCLMIKAICDKYIYYEDVEIIEDWIKDYREHPNVELNSTEPKYDIPNDALLKQYMEWHKNE